MLSIILASLLSMAEVAPPQLAEPNAELSGYLMESAENHPALKARYTEWRAMLERIPQAKSLDDPMLTFGYFAMSDTNLSKTTLGQRFPWFGTLRARGDKAAAEADASLARFYVERNRLFLQVRKAFYEYSFLGQRIKVTETQLEILAFMEETVRARYSLGLAQEADLLRIQIETTKVSDRLNGLLAMRPAMSSLLSESMGRGSLGTVLLWPVTSPLPDTPPTLEDVLPRIRSANPTFAVLAHEKEGRAVGVQLARKKGKPNATFGVDFMRRSDMGGEDFLMPMVTVNLPIWRKRVQADITEGRLREKTIEHETRRMELSLERQAQQAVFELEDARRRYMLFEESLLPQAEQSYQSLESTYASGSARSDFLDFLGSVQLLLEFQLDQLRAARDVHVGNATLEMLMGGPWTAEDLH